MADVYIASKQKDIVLAKKGIPRFKVAFRDKPVKVRQEVADILVKDFPDNISILTEEEAKKLGFDKEQKVEKLTKTDFINMKKNEQVQWLHSKGIPANEVPDKEPDRVTLMLKVQEEEQ